MPEIKKYYPLSNPQKNIWYTEKFYAGTSIAGISATMRLKSSIDFKLLEQAINLLIKHNDSMRIRITAESGEPRQYISEYRHTTFEIKDFSKSDVQALYDWDAKMTRTPIFNENEDLFRFVLLKIDEETCGYLVMLHHIIGDAWTMVILGDEIMRYYQELKKNQPVDDEPKPSYLEYLDEENSYLESDRCKKDAEFWDATFETLPEAVVIKPRKSKDIGTAASRRAYILPLKLCNKIREHAALSGASIAATFLSAFVMYLNRVTGKEDIVLGTPVLNRTNARLKNTMGMFISTIPFRIQVNEEASYADFSRELTARWMGILRRQRYPLDEIIRDLRKKFGETDRIYDILFSYQNAKFERTEDSDNLDSRWHFSGHQSESLSVHINDRDNDEKIIINYDFLNDLFHAKDIDALHDHYIRLLWHAMDAPNKKISSIEMVSEKEKTLITETFNNTETDFPSDRTMLSFFEGHAAQSPDKTAVICGGESMSYGELNQKADALAYLLYQKGVRRGDITALRLYRSFEMMISILAAWKVGAAYLPMDPEHPEEHAEYVLINSNAKVLLSTSDILKNPSFAGILINVDTLSNETVQPQGDILPVGDPTDVAYVIYTSGSTGTPKGVMVEHRALVNRINWMNRKYPLNRDSVILQKTTYTFDVSVWELTWWFYAGVTMVFLPPGDEKHPDRLTDTISQCGITTLHFVPSMLNVFLDFVASQGDIGKLGTLKQVFASGEALTPQQVNKFNTLLNSAHGTNIFNLYGPTEAAIDVSYFDCPTGTKQRVIPIGKPIDNIRLYILDKHGNIQPVGIPGELHIAGVGLARGYLNNPELTAQKFIADPLAPNERLYKTGDLARWFPQGDIEYLGRIDHQVKIRGFRVELGDIQHHLEQHPAINEAVIACRETAKGDKYLAAYYVSAKEITATDLHYFLAGRLPEYMIPAYFLQIDRIPLSHNGKVNASLLPVPTPSSDSATISRNIVTPRSMDEETVMKAWKAVLETDHLSVTDNFFQIGGDSISAIDMVCRLPAKVNVSKLYEHPVLEDFARHFREKATSGLLTRLAGPENAALSYILCPYGGGGAYTYHETATALFAQNPTCNVYSIALPGHDFGAESGGFMSINDVAALVLAEATVKIDGEIVIYAHCVGSALGIELARLMEITDRTARMLFIGGMLPSRGIRFYGSFFDPWKFFNNKQLTKILARLGLPAEGININEMTSLLEAFRYDVRSYYKYLSSFMRMQQRLNTPIHTILGEADPMTNRGKQKNYWSTVSHTTTSMTKIGGAKHYFVKTHADELAKIMTLDGDINNHC